jgi:hypothetical protein
MERADGERGGREGGGEELKLESGECSENEGEGEEGRRVEGEGKIGVREE